MTDQTEREALTIHKNTGEWLSGGTITGKQGAVIAASVLPGVTPEQVEAFYASVMDDRPTPRTVTTVEWGIEYDIDVDNTVTEFGMSERDAKEAERLSPTDTRAVFRHLADQTEREALRDAFALRVGMGWESTDELADFFLTWMEHRRPTPHVVTTVEALRDLPHGTHLRGALGQAYLVLDGGVFAAGRATACTDEALTLPATVLAPAIGPDDLPHGLVVSEDGGTLNWRGENYVRQADPDDEALVDRLDRLREWRKRVGFGAQAPWDEFDAILDAIEEASRG